MRGSFQRYHQVGSWCFNFAKRCAAEKNLGTSWNRRLSFHKLCDHWFLSQVVPVFLASKFDLRTKASPYLPSSQLHLWSHVLFCAATSLFVRSATLPFPPSAPWHWPPIRISSRASSCGSLRVRPPFARTGNEFGIISSRFGRVERHAAGSCRMLQDHGSTTW